MTTLTTYHSTDIIGQVHAVKGPLGGGKKRLWLYSTMQVSVNSFLLHNYILQTCYSLVKSYKGDSIYDARKYFVLCEVHDNGKKL